MNISEINRGKTMLTLSSSAGLAEAVSAFEGAGSHLAVVDESGKIVGLLTEADVRCASESGTAGSWMRSSGEALDSDTPVGQVAARMASEKCGAFLLKNKKEEIVGMVTSADLLAYLAELVGAEEGSTLEALPYSPVLNEAMRELNAVGL